MDYEKALQSEHAIAQIKEGIDIEKNIQILEDAFKPIIENEKTKQHKRDRQVSFVYANFNPLTEITKAIHALSGGKNHYETAMEELRRREIETQDILHAIELTDVDDEALNGLGRDLQEVRRDRRVAKNFTELAKPLYEFATKHPDAIATLRKAHGEMMKIDQQLKNRTYTPKEKTNMEIAFESLTQKLERIDSK